MTTKEKIRETARQLFNKQGIDIITTRHIAAQMGISHGNLCYHYSRKELIIEQLYYDLVKRLDDEISQRQTVIDLNLQSLFGLTEATFAIQYHYRFILLHMVDIMRKIETVGQHFRALLLKRRDQFQYFIDTLIKQGIFKEEQFQGQYQYFITQFYLVGDFWLSEAEILFEGAEEQKAPYYTKVAKTMITPYLTEQGWQAFRQLMAL